MQPLLLKSDFRSATVVSEDFLASVDVSGSDKKNSVADSLKLRITFLSFVLGVGKPSNAMVVYEPLHGKSGSDLRINAPHGAFKTFDVSSLSLLEHSRSFIVVRVNCNDSNNVSVT